MEEVAVLITKCNLYVSVSFRKNRLVAICNGKLCYQSFSFTLEFGKIVFQTMIIVLMPSNTVYIKLYEICFSPVQLIGMSVVCFLPFWLVISLVMGSLSITLYSYTGCPKEIDTCFNFLLVWR